MIKLTSARRVGGVEYPADTVLSLDAALEAGLIFKGLAVRFGISPDAVGASTPVVMKFPDFSPSILASLVAGATYGQSGSLVTVTATAHGLPTNRDGYRIFWPGSAAIPAGWYFGFEYVDANTYTFQNPMPQTIAAGTAITGTLPYVTQTNVCSLTIQAGGLAAGSKIRACVDKFGDATAATKTHFVFINGTAAFSDLRSTIPGICAANAIVILPGQTKAFAWGNLENSQNVGITTVTKDFTGDVLIEVRGSTSAASSYIAIDNAYLELIK